MPWGFGVRQRGAQLRAGRQSTELDDFIVRRADGVPAYQVAVVVDDAAQEIGEVVRGADLTASTARQIELQRLLGLPRAGTLADRGEPAAVTLALLAHTLGLATGRARVESAHELLGEFDPDRLPRQPIRVPAP